MRAFFLWCTCHLLFSHELRSGCPSLRTYSPIALLSVILLQQRNYLIWNLIEGLYGQDSNHLQIGIQSIVISLTALSQNGCEPEIQSLEHTFLLYLSWLFLLQLLNRLINFKFDEKLFVCNWQILMCGKYTDINRRREVSDINKGE